MRAAGSPAAAVVLVGSSAAVADLATGNGIGFAAVSPRIGAVTKFYALLTASRPTESAGVVHRKIAVPLVEHLYRRSSGFRVPVY